MSTKTSSVSQSPQQAQERADRADRLRDGFVAEDIFPLDDTGSQAGSDGNPAAWLADLSQKLDYADCVALALCAERLILSPAAGYWARRQARIDAMLAEPLPTPSAREIQSIRGFLASLTREAS